MAATLTKLLFLILLGEVYSFRYPLNCNPDICQCAGSDVICITNNRSEVIPQDLSLKTRSLQVTYQSSDRSAVSLEVKDVARYKAIIRLILHGDFSSINARVFENFTELRIFELGGTHISSLPATLFANIQSLDAIFLSQNKFTEIPLDIFGESDISATKFTFSHQTDVFLPCANQTLVLPTAFQKFKSLRKLDLSYVNFSNPNCSNDISDDFLMPITNVTHLTVSGTDFLNGKEHVLRQLPRLTSFQIDDMPVYKICPSRAIDLFNNIPYSVQSISATYWQTADQLTEECLITTDTLQGLANTKLERLYLSSNDGIFGPTIRQGVIPNITTLKILGLSYCRFSAVDVNAFAGLPKLSSLALDGNPLGAKDFNFQLESPDSVRFITLSSISVFDLLSSSNTAHVLRFDASSILCSFPNLLMIDLSNNDIDILPTFRQLHRCNKTSYMRLENLWARSTSLVYFTMLDAADNICETFPALKSLNLRGNQLISLDGLEACVNLEDLSIGDNRHWDGRSHSSTELTPILQHLTKLKNLELSASGLTDIDPELMSSMTELTQIIFTRNYVQQFDEFTFKHNRLMEYIDMSYNSLLSIHPAVFDGLDNLIYLDLQGNLIATIPITVLTDLDALAWPYIQLFLRNNPYDCDCSNKYFQTWFNNRSDLTEEEVLYTTCSSPARLKGQRVSQYEVDYFECYLKNVIIIGGSIVSGFLVTLVIALPCYKYRWYVTHLKAVWKSFMGSLELIKLEKVCPYDAYLSFDPNSHADAMWVVEELLPAIKGSSQPSGRTSNRETNLKIYLEPRDSLGGTSRFTEREIALSKSKRILIVLSNSYLKSVDCLSEADLSGIQMHGTEFYQPNRILVLIREELSREIIRPPISSLLLGQTLTVETSERKKKVMWSKLRAFLSKPLYFYSTPKANSPEPPQIDAPAESSETTPLLNEAV